MRVLVSRKTTGKKLGNKSAGKKRTVEAPLKTEKKQKTKKKHVCAEEEKVCVPKKGGVSWTWSMAPRAAAPRGNGAALFGFRKGGRCVCWLKGWGRERARAAMAGRLRRDAKENNTGGNKAGAGQRGAPRPR